MDQCQVKSHLAKNNLLHLGLASSMSQARPVAHEFKPKVHFIWDISYIKVWVSFKLNFNFATSHFINTKKFYFFSTWDRVIVEVFRFYQNMSTKGSLRSISHSLVVFFKIVVLLHVKELVLKIKSQQSFNPKNEWTQF